MTGIVEPPPASGSPIEHADWIELCALRAPDEDFSYQDFVSQLRVSGSIDAVSVDSVEALDSGGEIGERIADAAWTEIDRRQCYCGGEGGGYPFVISANTIHLKPGARESAYAFQLLISLFGKDAGPTGTFGERLFEEVCAVAGQRYFGGSANRAQCFRFGFPRPDRSNFRKALEGLTAQLRCGKVNVDAELIGDQQDSHLDLVIWRPFACRREGQAIAFGQCATGGNWREKLTELQPLSFADEWLHESFRPEPQRMFFLPRCIETRYWRQSTIYGGIVFDRCRISELTTALENDLSNRVGAWSAGVLDSEE